MNALASLLRPRGIALAADEVALDIALSNRSIDDTAAAGTVIGALSVTKGSGWAFALTDSAGNQFAIAGANVVVGATALNHDNAPTPQITVTATSGADVLARTFSMNVRKPLPALPLAAGSRLNLVGHSQIGYTSYGGSALALSDLAAGTDAKGIFAGYHAFDPRFDMDSWYDAADPLARNIAGANFGVFQAHLDAIADQLTLALAHKPEAIALMPLTNSIATGDTGVSPADVGNCIDKTEKMLQRCRNAGVPVILLTDYPRGAWTVDSKGIAAASKNAALAAARDWELAQIGREGVYVVDYWEVLAPGGVIDASLMQVDLTHLNPRGAAILARRSGALSLQSAIQTIFAVGEQFAVSDPTTADQLLTAANYNLAAAGAVSGAGLVTGTKATALSLTGYPTVGSSAVCSMEQIGATGRYKQVVTVTPGDNGSGNAYHGMTWQLPNAAITGLAAGDWVRHSLIVEIGGDTEHLAEFRLRSQICQSSTPRAQAYLMNTSSADFSARPGLPAGIYYLISPPMRIPEGVTFDRERAFLEAYWSRTAVGSFWFKFHSEKWAKITDPRIARGY